MQSLGAERDAYCKWVLDTKDGRFERLMLASGYYMVDMHDESLDALAGLQAEDLTRDEQAAVHERLGRVHNATKSLEKLFPLPQAVEMRTSRVLPGAYRLLPLAPAR